MTDFENDVTTAQSPQPDASRARSWILLAVIVALTLAADQSSKEWAQNDLRTSGGQVKLLQTPAFLAAFTYVRNPGAAWGLFAGADESFRRPFFFVVSLAAIVFILVLFGRLHADQGMAMVALALVLGGAIGNFIDRLRYGYVVDFLDLRYADFRWPTFNVADAAISVGVGLLLIDMFVAQQRQRRAQRQSPSA